jgi:hypothetical protein
VVRGENPTRKQVALKDKKQKQAGEYYYAE